MRYSKKTFLLILFVFFAFSWPHAAEAIEEEYLPELVNKGVQNAKFIKAAAENYYFHFWMKRYLAQDVDINYSDEFRRTALHYATVYFRGDTAEFLLKNGKE